MNKERSQTTGQALRSLGVTEDVLRKSVLRLDRLDRAGRLVVDDASGYERLRGAYYELLVSVIDVLAVGETRLNVDPDPVPPLPVRYRDLPQRDTQARQWMQDALTDGGLTVAITDKAGPLNEVTRSMLLGQLRRRRKTKLLLRSMGDKSEQAITLTRLAALYDIYLDYRIQEESIENETSGFLAQVPPHIQTAAVRVGPVLMGAVGMVLHSWLTGGPQKRERRSLSRVSRAIREAEGG